MGAVLGGTILILVRDTIFYLKVIEFEGFFERKKTRQLVLKLSGEYALQYKTLTWNGYRICICLLFGRALIW